jgi:potassium-transporting ATPase KdpC subunit
MRTLIISFKIFLFFTVLTGVIYPLLVTGIAQLCFQDKANGSIIRINGKGIGSELIGQQSDTIRYFSSRPSAVSYNPLPSGGSNYGLTNMKLKHQVDSLKNHFIAFNQLDSQTNVPSEMLFASASGLDPHISPEAALLQVNRICKARNLDSSHKQQLIDLVRQKTEKPQYGLLGDERINVLLLNIELDKIR